MSDGKIAEIRARHDAVNNVLRGASQMHADRGYLLAEVERLTRERDEARADVDRLTGKLKLVVDALDDTISKYHEVGDQNDRLDAENERLREALTDMLTGWRYIRETYGDLAGIGWDRAESKAQEALEAKP